jgi:hypothetical protein
MTDFAAGLSLVATILWLSAGFIAVAHLVRTRDLDWAEWAALSGGVGLVILVGLTLLGLLPRPAAVAVAVALMVALPIYLYFYYKRLFATADRPADRASQGSRHALALVLLVAVAAFFRFTWLGYSEFQGDEARAVLMAHQMGRSGSPEVLMLHKKGPIEVLLPAASVRWGDLSERSARLPFAIAGLLGILAAFGLGTRLWGARAGFAAGILLAVDGYLIAFSRIVQYQSVVFLFSVLAVWCAWRFHQRAAEGDRYLALAGLFIGLGTWAHYEMIFALPPVVWLVIARVWAERPREVVAQSVGDAEATAETEAEPEGGRGGGGNPGDEPEAEVGRSVYALGWLRRLALPIALMLGTVALFYIPFIRHPHFAETSAYIIERRVGGGLPYNMLGDYFNRASFYNASYYVMFMVAVLVGVIVARLRVAWGRAGLALAAVWLALFAILAARPGLFEIGAADAEPRRSLAVLVFLPVFAALVLAPRTSAKWRALLLWFAGPFFAATFFVQKPHTHFYTLLPAWALMVGWGLDRGLVWLEGRFAPRLVRIGAVAAGIALFAVFALHQYVVFIRHDPEYKRVYPEVRLPGYWTPFGDEPPRGGYFGFPYRAGWNTVRDLVETGLVSGDYDSNEELLVTGLYTNGAPRCLGGDEPATLPRYYLEAWRPQDAEEIPLDVIARDYHLGFVIRRGGRDKLKVHERELTEGDPIVIEEGVDDIYAFLHSGLPDYAEGSGVVPVVPPPGRSIPVAQALELPLPEVRRDARLGDAVRLVGLDFPLASEAFGAIEGAARHVGAGPSAPAVVHGIPGSIGITFLWQAIAPQDRDLSVFVHLVDAAGTTVAQSDGAPGCGQSPTSTWRPAEIVFDPHTIELPEDLPAGVYTVRAGLYNPADGTRLPVDEGGAVSDAVTLWSFELQNP